MLLMGEDSRELTGKVGWREGSGISKGPRVTVSAVVLYVYAPTTRLSAPT